MSFQEVKTLNLDCLTINGVTTTPVSTNGLIPWNNWTLVLNTGSINSNWYFNQSMPSTSQNLGTVDYILGAAGSYTLSFVVFENTDAGILQLTVNGTLVDTIDLYNAATNTAVLKSYSLSLLSGLNTIKLNMNGKNAGSSNYYAYFLGQGLSLYKTT